MVGISKRLTVEFCLMEPCQRQKPSFNRQFFPCKKLIICSLASYFISRILKMKRKSYSFCPLKISAISLYFFQPFVEKGHPIQRLFLPRMYAVVIPVIAGLVLLGVIGNSNFNLNLSHSE